MATRRKKHRGTARARLTADRREQDLVATIAKASGVLLCTLVASSAPGSGVPPAIVDSLWAASDLLTQAQAERGRD